MSGDAGPDGGLIGGARRLLAGVLPGGDFVRGTLTIASATGAAQLISILGSPVITRLYSPAAYGAFAVAGSILTLLMAVACLRYEQAVPLPRSAKEAANVLAVCLIAATGISIALIPILWIVGAPLLAAVGAGALGVSMWLLPAGVLAGAALNAFGNWMIRLKSFPDIAASRLVQSGTTIAVQIGLGVVGVGAPGLLTGTVVGSVAGVARLARAAWRRSSDAFESVNRAGTRAAAARFRRFPIFSTPSIAINVIGLEAPLVWVVATYGAETGGQLALAQRIVALPITVLALAVGQVYFAEAARVARERPAELQHLFGRTTRALVLISAPPFLLGALVAPFLFPVIFGADWTTAGLYVAILAPMYFLQFVVWPTGGTLDVLERQDLHLAREVGRLVLVVGVIGLVTVLRLPPLGAVIAISGGGSLTNLLYGAISWRAIRRGHRPGGAHQGAEAAGQATGDMDEPGG